MIVQQGWCQDNHRAVLHERGDVSRWSPVRLFLMPSSLVRADWLCGCPQGAQEQSGSGISHSLNSQGLWPSTDFTANWSLTPSPLLFAQLWIFTCFESNSVRHATVQPDNVSPVVFSICRRNQQRLPSCLYLSDLTNENKTLKISGTFLIFRL